MISKILRVGDRVEMKRYTLSDSADAKPRLYVSQIIDMIDEQKLNLSIPIEGGRIIPLEVGSKYELRFLSSSGIYVCKAEIVNRGKQGTIYFLTLLILSELKKDQRRQYFRLNKIRPLKYHILTDEENELLARVKGDGGKDDFEYRTIFNRLRDIVAEESNGTLQNISGGGIKFNSGKELHPETLIRINLLLDDADREPLDLFAHVIASQYMSNTMNFEHRVEFVHINREVREHIVKYVFSEERKQRQKESGL